MAKVLCERPRAGGWGNEKNYKRKVYESMRDEIPVKFESMKKRLWERKDFTDLISPLYKFIEGKVGSRWNDVYSEIRERVNPNSLQQIHLLGHVKAMVEQNVVMVGEQPYIVAVSYRKIKGVGQGYIPLTSMNVNHYYVDPRDGILKKAPLDIYKKKEEKKEYIWIDDMSQYRLIKCKNQWIWFYVKFVPLEYRYYDGRKAGNDVVLKKTIFELEAMEKYGKKIYANFKKQLNKKEIKILFS